MSSIPQPECVTTHGLLAGGVVGQPTWNDDVKVQLAERSLHAKLRQDFFAVSPDADFRVWSERGPIHTPNGAYLSHGWKLHFAVKPPFHEKLNGIIDQLPNEFEGFQLWFQPWSEAPIRETFQQTGQFKCRVMPIEPAAPAK
jgi:hypothetical protein